MRQWGSGDRKALVLHGISSNSAGWWRLGPDLARLGYEVTAPDLRGHGESPKPDEMQIAHYAEDVIALGTGWDLVLGHSLGGAIALEVMSQIPDWTRRLILQDPAILGSNAPEIVDGLLEDYAEPITAERIAAGSPHWHPTDAEIKAEALKQSGPRVIHGTVRDGVLWNYWGALEDLAVPTLLIGADPEMGALVPPLIGEAAAVANPSIRFVTVFGGSHSMHRDEYDAYWAVVEEFAA